MGEKEEQGVIVSPAPEDKINENVKGKPDGYGTKGGAPSQTIELAADIMEYLGKLRDRLAESERVERNKSDWQRVSRVLDRLFFVIIVIIMLISGIVMISMIVKHSKDGGPNKGIMATYA